MAADSDDLDVAATLTQHLADAQVAAVRSLAQPEQVQNADGTWPYPECRDCGADFPERRAIGKTRCLRCQTSLERSWPR